MPSRVQGVGSSVWSCWRCRLCACFSGETRSCKALSPSSNAANDWFKTSISWSKSSSSAGQAACAYRVDDTDSCLVFQGSSVAFRGFGLGLKVERI